MKKLPTLVLLSALASTPSASPRRLPLIEDDYGRARAEANARHVPLFVDVWAPW